MNQFKCIVLDDVLKYNDVKDFKMVEFLTSKKNTKIIACQQPSDLQAVDYVYMFKDNLFFTKDKLYKTYGFKYYKTYDDFNKDFEEATQEYGTLVLNNIDNCINKYNFDYNSVMSNGSYCLIQ